MKLSEKQEQLLQEIPHNYDFIRHIILMMGESIILVIFSLAILIILHTPLTWYLFVPAFSFLFLGGEWLIHKYLLHRNFIPSLFKFHQKHHILYHDDSMKFSSWKELYFILIPLHTYYALAMILLGIAICISYFNMFLALLFMLSAFLFHIIYESLHFCHHYYQLSISRYHTIHHNPSNMSKFNFNVSLPIIDWFVGTLKKEE